MSDYIEFSPELRDALARVDDLKRKLRRLGAVGPVELGPCSHGFVAGVHVQIGRVTVQRMSHGAPTPADALDDLVEQIAHRKQTRYQ